VLVVTTEAVAGHVVRKVIGEVTGATVRSTNAYLEGVKSLSGTANPRMGTLLARWRREAVAEMVAAARRQGANAVIAMRYDHRDIGQAWVEICAYGTAVVIVARDERARRRPTPHGGGEAPWSTT
jgi:uncharacterized protein YbjQ (UPF0145 family)